MSDERFPKSKKEPVTKSEILVTAGILAAVTPVLIAMVATLGYAVVGLVQLAWQMAGDFGRGMMVVMAVSPFIAFPVWAWLGYQHPEWWDKSTESTKGE